MNGREWLSRQMDKAGLKYRKQGNCFVWIEDYRQAQKLLDGQLETAWAQLLEGFAEQLNPIQQSIFERYPASYYWTSYQSEWATDMVFKEADFLKRLMPLLVRHSVLSFWCADVMRYFGRKVNQTGVIPASFSGTLQAGLKRRQEGERVKYRMNALAHVPWQLDQVLRPGVQRDGQCAASRNYHRYSARLPCLSAQRRGSGRGSPVAVPAERNCRHSSPGGSITKKQRAIAEWLGECGRQPECGGADSGHSVSHQLGRPEGARLTSLGRR